uniref:Uncharacterized protein n=1 Tax=Rhizophora mucronata TaxID=61149 RepID=A0A2P2PXJ2_RHIMU
MIFNIFMLDRCFLYDKKTWGNGRFWTFLRVFFPVDNDKIVQVLTVFYVLDHPRMTFKISCRVAPCTASLYSS